MTSGQLQESIDVLRATSKQRWLLTGSSVAAPVAATAVITAGSGGFSAATAWLFALVVALAVAAAVYPDSFTGLVIIGTVAWQWTATVDDVTTPRSLVVAICLVISHAVLALMAVTPHTAVVDRSLLFRWARRTANVIGVTAAMWLLVVGFERGAASGSALLTFLALTVVVAGVVALRMSDGRSGSPRDS